ncbi:unnamed protein product [Symbiodinium sp. CCMP2592]|nr:unnamed protein product [Symbiodinium sp. CCMP2592]
MRDFRAGRVQRHDFQEGAHRDHAPLRGGASSALLRGGRCLAERSRAWPAAESVEVLFPLPLFISSLLQLILTAPKPRADRQHCKLGLVEMERGLNRTPTASTSKKL